MVFSSSPKLKKHTLFPIRSIDLQLSLLRLFLSAPGYKQISLQTHKPNTLSLSHTHIYNSQFTVQSPQQPAMASRFQAIPLVATPSYPNAVAWSDENLIAVASGHLVTILVPLFLTTLLFFFFVRVEKSLMLWL